LFRPDDVEDLAETLASLVVDAERRQRLAQAGQQAVREQFSVSQMVEQTLQALV
jgi:glycosyltransferase involved in cell wall biosynthesis